MKVKIRNRGKMERGPFHVKHSAPSVTADKVVRPGKAKSPAEIGRGRFAGTIAFGAVGSTNAEQLVDERDLGNTPLGRALKDPNDTLVIVK